MGMEMRQELKLSQQLVMTPQLQQAIKLLQLSRMELAEMVHEELLENPLMDDEFDLAQERSGEREQVGGDEQFNSQLEGAGQTEIPLDQPKIDGAAQSEVKGDASAVGEIDWENYLDSYQSGPANPGFRGDSDELPGVEATLTKPPSLHDHLAWQLKLTDLPPKALEIGLEIIGNIDADGYIKDPPLSDIAADLGATEEECEIVLEKIQTFDPVGIAARSLAECMLIQAMHAGQDDDLVVKMIRSHLGNLEKKNYQAIARDLKQPLDEVYEAAKVVMEFDPRPGRQYSSDDAHYITPDVYIHKVGDKFFVVPNDDGLPKLKISNFYKSAMGTGAASKDYVQDKLRSAQWLIRSIQQRQRTIIKVAESILKFQRDFFDKGIAHLRPLILRDVAEDIGMHESTVSRVTTNKYVHTPQGIFELKFFFSSGISRTNGEDMASQAVKSKIKELVDGEDAKRPHSDQKLVELLKTGGIDIARRTVAKYREQMGILSSSKRKQVF
ncbi:MAG: RNA polymerase factor sigma-54 [Kofleriaceae bacterium]|jgi:RNA polymerase sigma-54 factor|nr:RNA polymerase factor sigma-54 [Kofleriaceae bacterium]MBP6838437.1 RNA polymerase factor sigma-54 [Kofleriaceae bacterium]MBP9204722.1 RNA polymerase factor sigma-54 [Kofleriaceae bacterium]